MGHHDPDILVPDLALDADVDGGAYAKVGDIYKLPD